MDSKIILAVVLFLSFAGCNRNSDTSEEDRSQIHFSLNRMELGNPVELLFFDDEYHLFYRAEDTEERASWGHAKSKDLIHWETMNRVLESEGEEKVGSGSIVIDWNHTSGLGDENPPLVAVYIVEGNHGDRQGVQTLAVAVSRDQGNSWTKLPAKEIELANSYEPLADTKIIWHEETQRWMMLVLTGYEVRFYASTDLLNWEYTSVFGEDILLKTGQWTNLDFFPIDSQWALLISGDSGSPNEGSGIQYFIGEFDGYTYQSLDDKQKWLDNGSDLYASVTYAGNLQLNQPPILIGRIFNQKYQLQSDEVDPGQTLSFPRELFLREKYGEHYISARPIEIGEEMRIANQAINNEEVVGELELKMPDLPFEIDLSIDINNRLYLDLAEAFGIRLSSESGDQLLIGYHALRRYFFISNVLKTEEEPKVLERFEYMPYMIDRTMMDVKIIVDHTSIELFAVDGDVSLTRKLLQPNEWNELVVFTENGRIKLNEVNVAELQSIN